MSFAFTAFRNYISWIVLFNKLYILFKLFNYGNINFVLRIIRMYNLNNTIKYYYYYYCTSRSKQTLGNLIIEAYIACLCGYTKVNTFILLQNSSPLRAFMRPFTIFLNFYLLRITFQVRLGQSMTCQFSQVYVLKTPLFTLAIISKSVKCFCLNWLRTHFS